MAQGDKLARGGKSATFTGAVKEMPGTSGIWDMDRDGPLPESYPYEPAGEITEVVQQKPAIGYEGQPVGDSILVQRVEREHSSLLVLPDSLKAKSDIGYVVAVGEEAKKAKQGTLILFDRFASHGADIDLIDSQGVQRSFLLLKDYDVLMSLKKIAL